MSENPKLCPTYIAAMGVLGKPWNGLLLAVLEDGPLRFSEIAARLPQIADRMLAGRLKELEARGVIVRTVDHGPPVRVSYALTEVGRGFREVSEAMSRWGRLLLEAEHPSGAAPKRARRARAG